MVTLIITLSDRCTVNLIFTINDQEFVMSQEFVIVDFLSRIQSLLLQIFFIDSYVERVATK